MDNRVDLTGSEDVFGGPMANVDAMVNDALGQSRTSSSVNADHLVTPV